MQVGDKQVAAAATGGYEVLPDRVWFATRAQAWAYAASGLLVTESEAMQMSREQDFITEARAAARALWDAINTLEKLQPEWTALDYGTTLDAGVGENAGITGAQVGAVVFDTANAMRGVLNAGHATNVARLL